MPIGGITGATISAAGVSATLTFFFRGSAVLSDVGALWAVHATSDASSCLQDFQMVSACSPVSDGHHFLKSSALLNAAATLDGHSADYLVHPCWASLTHPCWVCVTLRVELRPQTPAE